MSYFGSNLDRFGILLFTILLAVVQPAIAQFQEGGGIYEPATKKLIKAQQLFESLAYHDAIPLYHKYLENTTDSTAMLQLADCYRLTSDFMQAEKWYALGLQYHTAEPRYYLNLAQMQQANMKYPEAAKSYTAYLKLAPEDKRAANQKLACEQYGQFMQLQSFYDVQNLLINTSGYDFAPTWRDNMLYFSSSRDTAKSISKKHSWTGTEFFDMYKASADGHLVGDPALVRKDASTRYHEANAGFTPDGSQVYFTRNNFYNGKAAFGKDRILKMSMYRSDVNGLVWSNDQPFEYNDDDYSIGHPVLSPDGNTLYYVSDMPGGMGSTDLYFSVMTGGKWSSPQNMGPGINTEGYEMFPYVSPDGELYFASDGHGGMGGLDIFSVEKNKTNNTWGSVQNVGAPLNSSADDFGFTFGKDRSSGYFTSNRQGGYGLDDIYSFTHKGFIIKGVIVDANTGDPICSARISVNQNMQQLADRRELACDGEFTLNVIQKNDLSLDVSVNGYQPLGDFLVAAKDMKPGEKLMVRIPLEKTSQRPVTVMVRDRLTKDRLPEVKVTADSDCDTLIHEAVTDAKGMTCFLVACSCKYGFNAVANGYLPGSGSLEIANNCDQQFGCGDPGIDSVVIELDKYQQPPAIQQQVLSDQLFIELKDIYYDFNKSNLRPESEPQLNKLLGFLKDNPDAVVEIASFTDSRASFDYNIRLSQMRAQSVVAWLVSHGIENGRLKPKGYGETRLRNNCSDNVQCSEYEHQRNRRTEFRVIGGKISIESLERFDMDVDPLKK